MTEFDKAVKHIKTCLFWDFADGQWLDTLYTPLDRDFFNRLMQGVVDAHEAENAKLRELVRDMMAFVDDDEACEHCGHDVECVDAAQGELVLPYEGQCLMLDVFESRMRELGIEVDEP